MSHRRQAKTHICHRETDVTAPPSHFYTPSLTLWQSLIHSLHSPISDVFFPIQAHIIYPSKPSPHEPPNHMYTHPFPVASASYHLTHTHNLLLTISAMGFAMIIPIWSKTKAWEKLLTDGFQAGNYGCAWNHVCISVSVCLYHHHLSQSVTSLLFTRI